MEAVRFARLVIEEGDQSVSLVLHPRLTVVAGLDQAARKGLVAELIGGLGSTRRGVNLELRDDHGRQLAVLRPAEGGHKVVDIGARADVSDEFRGPDGRLDLLDRFGLDLRRAKEVLHLDRDALAMRANRNDDVMRLAELDQTKLWSAAARVRITDDETRSLASEDEGTAADADVVDRIERQHQKLEQAATQLRRTQRQAALVCAASLIAAVAVLTVSTSLALPLLAIVVATAVFAVVLRTRVAAAERSEASALADAGAGSYLDFMVSRVDHMMQGSDAHRRRNAVAEDHRNAAVAWTRIAGDVSVEWALEHHEQIDTAARLRRELASLGQISSTAPTLDE